MAKTNPLNDSTQFLLDLVVGTGSILIWNVDKKAYECFCRGSTAVSNKREMVVIDNATNGFTLYSLDSSNAIRTFFTDALTVPVPKQVAFGEESKVVIGGSDCGVVYVHIREEVRTAA